MQHTLAIIKPDAVKKQAIGGITGMIEKAGLTIVAAKMLHLTHEQASQFYAIHQARPFFNDLVNFMTSGPVMVYVLAGDNAIQRYRDLMGATNPSEAAAGTIRATYANSIDENAVHGSDAEETAANEVPFFFSPSELHATTV